MRWYDDGAVAIFHEDCKTHPTLFFIQEKLLEAHWQELAEWTAFPGNQTATVDSCVRALAARELVISMLVPYKGRLWCAQTSHNQDGDWQVENSKPVFKHWGLYLVPAPNIEGAKENRQSLNS